jgi:enoyl-CoA hydratase
VTEGQDQAAETELLIETRGHVRLLTINRPDRRNSLSRSLMGDLVEAFLSSSEDPEVRAIVLTGTGDGAFCAGADLKEMREGDAAGTRFRPPMNQPGRNVFEVVTETFKPVIAALNGSAVAGGFELALACDIRIAAPGIKLGLPEAKIGMGANFGSVVLPKRIPLGVAMEMLFTGDYIDTETAERWGLVNRVVPRDAVLPEAIRLAERIAENAPLSVRRMKEVAVKGLELPLWSALRLDVGPNPYLSEDRKEGIRARLEGRRPQWQGR